MSDRLDELHKRLAMGCPEKHTVDTTDRLWNDLAWAVATIERLTYKHEQDWVRLADDYEGMVRHRDQLQAEVERLREANHRLEQELRVAMPHRRALEAGDG